MIWFHCQYLSHPHQLDFPYVSPARCTDLGGLPEALVLVPELDPLRDVALVYVERLTAAGVQARSVVFPGVIHGFWQLGALMPEARTAINEAARSIRSCLSKASGASAD
jgi:acetyl esterase